MSTLHFANKTNAQQQTLQEKEERNGETLRSLGKVRRTSGSQTDEEVENNRFCVVTSATSATSLVLPCIFVIVYKHRYYGF